jgi:hypothetical protein
VGQKTYTGIYDFPNLRDAFLAFEKDVLGIKNLSKDVKAKMSAFARVIEVQAANQLPNLRDEAVENKQQYVQLPSGYVAPSQIKRRNPIRGNAPVVRQSEIAGGASTPSMGTEITFDANGNMYG